MPHRMDVELTSVRDDETFTWRAAGARQPKGAVPVALLPKGSKVGDVVRIEAEVEIDGITVVSVLPPKEKEQPSGRIEIVGTKPPVAGVTTVLAGPTGRRPDRFFRDGEERRPARPGGDRRPRRDGEGPADSRAKPPASADQPSSGGGERRPPRGPDGAGRHRRPGTEVASARRDLNPPRRDAASSGPSADGSPRGRGPRPESASSSRPGAPASRSGAPGSRAGAPPRREGPGRAPDARGGTSEARAGATRCRLGAP